ncbi:hypothetical protein [Cryptosporangium phraense]|uniref:Uncharacterized protein n=1 Tax=Cryptosporangium phraense TaxID=2593070 RepID=A0A545AJC4_9ACTN|nr:hypothetical protein [Cryptosporangium phraense]TQS41350.1 hypothetical protein FL583_30045 [Cryptosporangium phraense]
MPPLRRQPPTPLQIVVAVLVVLGGLIAVYAAYRFLATSGTVGDRLTAAFGFLVLSALTLWTAWMVYLGRRGGLVLATLIAVVLVIYGLLMFTGPAPWPVIGGAPTFLGGGMVLLLFLPAESRNWFRPTHWAG